MSKPLFFEKQDHNGKIKYTKACFMLVCFMLFCCNTPFQFMPVLIVLSHFRFNNLWLACLHVFKSFFLWEYDFLFTPF